MWTAALALSAFLQAGGVVSGRSCEPGNRDAQTTAMPRAAEVGRAVTLGLIREPSRAGPAPDTSPTPSPATTPG